MSTWEKYLEQIYFDPKRPASFSGPDKLYSYVKRVGKYEISKYKIRKWLQRQEAYSLQRPLRRKFKRNTIMVVGIDDQWSADLMDMVKFAKYNNGISYVLVVIDTFSKYLWLKPLKDKKGRSVVSAVKEIFQEGRVPTRIRTDKGQEFRAKEVQTLLKQRNITHLLAGNETKAAVSERAIKTIKSRMYRYFTHTQTYEYVDILQEFADSYNHTLHSTIGMSPIDVTIDKEVSVWWKMYWPKKNKIVVKTKTVRKPYRFKVGDKVRLTHLRNIFSREYDEKWTGEIFNISERNLRGGLPIYKIKDFEGDKIIGSFYQSELQKVDVKDDDMWKIESTLKTRGKGINKQYLVKWLHWPKKFNSWVKASDMKDL